MTAAKAGALSHGSTDWQAIEWQSAQRIVRRLQARIVKATQELHQRRRVSSLRR